ncbi:hypothetical protein MYX64_07230 [Nitrospinae bacterium AH_259_B05_G02_I21]|nr:hypothetical protein [Nitrospinae bacterium AH_259_B05_G02_I21]MDA2932106.1 hypothetical protein [Nitrospinae bacterium AH-259-F20]
MKKVYFDTNVIDRVEGNWEASEFESLLASQGFMLSIGLHVMYELAKGFLKIRSEDKIKSLFKFLDQLNEPHFIPPTRDLIRGEIYKVQGKGILLQRMHDENNRRTKEEVWRMANDSTDEATRFVEGRENEIRSETPQLSEEIIRQINKLRSTNPEYLKSIRNFVDFKNKLEEGDKLRILQMELRSYRLKVLDLDLKRILISQSDYPVINTWLNCNFYLNWIPARHQVQPGRDKLGDLRHVINCCASDLFVSDDEDLITLFPKLNPFKEHMSWNAFKSMLEGNNSI